MRIRQHTEQFNFTNPVVTIGIFDGVHTGHRFILEKLITTARKAGGESVAVTLWPHPRQVLKKDLTTLRYLSSFEEKIILLEQTGIDHLVVIEFTKAFSQLGSCEFIKDILADKIGIHHLIIGYNHKFGRNREGDFKNLTECAKLYNFTIEQTEPLINGGEMISSTLIRDFLLKGRIEESNRYLGYNYFMCGKVTGGNRIGREIGFPTANIKPHDEHKLIPGDGVYAVNLEANGITHNGMLNIGWRPTLNPNQLRKTIEVNIFEFEGDLYGSDVTLTFIDRIRDEKKFETIEQLRQQLVTDRETAKAILRSKPVTGKSGL